MRFKDFRFDLVHLGEDLYQVETGSLAKPIQVLLCTELLFKTLYLSETILAEVVGLRANLNDLRVEVGKFCLCNANPLPYIAFVRSGAN